MLTPDEIEDYAWRLTGGAEAVLESAVLEVLISEFVLVCGLDPGTVAALNAIVAGRANVRQAVSALIARYNPVVKSEAASLTFELLERGDAREATRLAAEYGKAPSDLSEVAAQAAAGIQQIVARDNVMMGQVAEDAWWDACTMVTTGSMSGEKILDELIAEGVDYLMRRGVSTVTYVDDEGNVTRRDSVDVAVRRHAMTQANQAGGRMTMQRMVEFGHDLVQTTAHLGARPTHEPWQGRAFSLTGPREVDGTVYPNFYEETGYGTVGGLQGANCRHTFYSYFPGDELPERPDPQENAERYRAEQKQRRIEREIRKCKQGIAGDQIALKALEESGNLNNIDELRNQLARRQVRLKNLQATMREHVSSHDYLARQPKREKDYLGRAGRAEAAREMQVRMKRNGVLGSGMFGDEYERDVGPMSKIGRLDMTDREQVEHSLDYMRHSIANEDKEVAFVIEEDGTVWRRDGTLYSVSIDGPNLTNAIVMHCHVALDDLPPSFGKDDFEKLAENPDVARFELVSGVYWYTLTANEPLTSRDYNDAKLLAGNRIIYEETDYPEIQHVTMVVLHDTGKVHYQRHNLYPDT